MVAWLWAPESDEAACIAKVLETAGYDVEQIAGGRCPASSPDVVVMLDLGKESWTAFAAVASSCHAPLVYLGSRPREAQRRLPELSAALPRPIRSVELRVTLETLGLAWGPARVPRAADQKPVQSQTLASRVVGKTDLPRVEPVG